MFHNHRRFRVKDDNTDLSEVADGREAPQVATPRHPDRTERLGEKKMAEEQEQVGPLYLLCGLRLHRQERLFGLTARER